MARPNLVGKKNGDLILVFKSQECKGPPIQRYEVPTPRFRNTGRLKSGSIQVETKLNNHLLTLKVNIHVWSKSNTDGLNLRQKPR